MCDGQGRPVRLHLTIGQISDFKGADMLLAALPDEAETVIGVRGYGSNKIRQSLADRNIPPICRQRRTGNQSQLTTGICIRSVI
ncbi:transposase [Acetobacter okinawensis]|uniref:transposase n=1 Tax=Acetobacter okinawensis TaxID=1076594 RepID=UPI001BA6D62C|nr:transposase [Acetobacter okinawensis]